MESEPLTLQLFIGTADDRLLRPHAFYQVHRITGKTVSTASHEVMQSNTKILEIPLLPENNMRAMWALAYIYLFVTFLLLFLVSFRLHTHLFLCSVLSMCDYHFINWELCLLDWCKLLTHPSAAVWPVGITLLHLKNKNQKKKFLFFFKKQTKSLWLSGLNDFIICSPLKYYYHQSCILPIVSHNIVTFLSLAYIGPWGWI